MSNHVRLTLNASEETLTDRSAELVKRVPAGQLLNPISDYFDTTDKLKAKILRAELGQDSELLGLMIIGVISAAEFYFRSIIGRSVEICPISARVAESATVPIGSFGFYSGSDYCFVLGSLEHESLADGKRVCSYVERMCGLKAHEDSSVKAALEGYELLCEVRHCLAHARGFVGLKAARALKIEDRSLSKVILDQTLALDLLKLSHNAVRAVNRFLADAILNRWVDKDMISGEWSADRPKFLAIWKAFAVRGEDAFGGNAWRAYAPVRRSALKRRLGMAAANAATAGVTLAS